MAENWKIIREKFWFKNDLQDFGELLQNPNFLLSFISNLKFGE